jgi:hypothetical protein
MGRNRQSTTSKSYSAPPPVPVSSTKTVHIHNTSPSVGSSFMSSMGGSLVGSYIGNKLFGSQNQNLSSNQGQQENNYKQNIYYETKKCLENNPFDYNQCKSYIDDLVNSQS